MNNDKKKCGCGMGTKSADTKKTTTVKTPENQTNNKTKKDK